MGDFSTQAHADAIRQAYNPLSVYQLHLTTNFYPPLPSEYGALLREAVEECAYGNYSAYIPLPRHLNPLPADAFEHEGELVVEASQLVNACRAWPFVDELLAFVDELLEDDSDV